MLDNLFINVNNIEINPTPDSTKSKWQKIVENIQGMREMLKNLEANEALHNPVTEPKVITLDPY